MIEGGDYLDDDNQNLSVKNSRRMSTGRNSMKTRGEGDERRMSRDNKQRMIKKALKELR